MARLTASNACAAHLLVEEDIVGDNGSCQMLRHALSGLQNQRQLSISEVGDDLQASSNLMS